MTREVYYPVDFAEWPKHAQAEWYQLHCGKEGTLRELREALDVDTEKSARLTREDMTAAIDRLSDGYQPLTVANNNKALLSALYDEAGVDGDPTSKMSTKEIAIVTAQVRDHFPSSPRPIFG